MQAQQGGAVFLKDTQNGTMTGNTFSNNTAKQGGAIYIQNSELEIK